MRIGNTQLIGGAVAAGGLLLTAFALLNPSSVINGHSEMMEGPTGTTAYALADMLLAIIGSFVMAAGLFVALFREDYERPSDLPPIVSTYQAVRPAPQAPLEVSEEEVEAVPPGSDEGRTGAACETVDERRLVLRLLTGDERAMFRAIVESGGEALQKDLIIKTKMSNAKVSRVLDRLVEKGVISKSRHGVTNKVKVEIEP